MSLFLFTILTGLVDCLNPSTIITQLLLLIKSRNTKLSSYFTIGTFFTYFITGLLLHFGIASSFKTILSSIEIRWNLTFVLVEIFVFLLLTIYLFKKINSKPDTSKTKNLLINPVSILLLSIGSTFADIPTALPYFLFIGKLEQSQLDTITIVTYFIIYNLIYILPLLILIFSYSRNKEYFEVYFEKIENIIDKVGTFLMYLILTSAIVVLVIDIILYSIDLFSIWEYFGFNFKK